MRIQRSTLVLVLVVASALLPASRVALADEAEAKARLSEVVKALDGANAKALAATFADDGRAIFPRAATEGYGKAGIEAAAAKWLAAIKGSRFVYVNTKIGSLGIGDWYSTELVATEPVPLKWRLTGVLRHAEDDGPAMHVAMHISAAIDNKAMLALAQAGKLPTLPAIPSGFDDGDWEEQVEVAALAKAKWNLKKAMVIGSAPKEVAAGAAGGKLLGSWKKLKIAVREEARIRSVVRPIELHVTVAHVTVATPIKGKVAQVPYRVLAAYTTAETPDGSPRGKPDLGIVHFSIATE